MRDQSPMTIAKIEEALLWSMQELELATPGSAEHVELERYYDELVEQFAVALVKFADSRGLPSGAAGF